MVLVTCNCLNIKLHLKQNPNTSPFDLLPDSGENSPFFPYKVQLVEICDPGITLEQDYLVHRHQCEDWLIHRCLNCGLDVYATKPRSSKLLISQNIQYDPAVIERLRQSSNYSTVFELVLPEKDSSFIEMPDRSSGGFELQDEISMIQAQLTNYLLHEESEMENRIKQYEEEQRQALQKVQEKMRKEKKRMISILIEAQKIKSENNGSSRVTNTPERSKPKGKFSQRTPLSRTKSTPVPRGQSLEEFDQNDNGMFMLDGIELDRDEPFYQSEDDDDDFNEDNEKQAPPTVKKNKLVYSTSVPISVPTWGARDNVETEDEDDDGSLLGDPDQIAASMQALAQSIHNDERYIFGDRPRPRLNTGDFTN